MDSTLFMGSHEDLLHRRVFADMLLVIPACTAPLMLRVPDLATERFRGNRE